MNFEKKSYFVRLKVGLVVFFFLINIIQSNQNSDHGFFVKFKSHQTTLKTWMEYKSKSNNVAFAKLRFYTMDTNVTLSLRSDNSILHAQFAIYAINGNDKKRNFHGRPENIFVGVVNGNQKHKAYAVLIEGLWFAYFNRPDGHAFVLESVSKSSVSSLQSIIVYQLNKLVKVKRSDNIMRKTSQPAKNTIKEVFIGQFNNGSPRLQMIDKILPITRDGDQLQRHRAEDSLTGSVSQVTAFVSSFVDHGQSDRLNLHNGTQSRLYEKARQNQQTDPHMSCNILAVVDYKAWKNLGFEDKASIASLLAFFFQHVDNILGRRLAKGLELKLAAVYIHSGCKVAGANGKHILKDLCNASNKAINVSGLLWDMSFHPDYKNYCLVHLTTSSYLNGLFGSSLLSCGPLDTNFNGLIKKDTRTPGLSDRQGESWTDEHFVNASKSAQRPRYIGFSSLLGCDQKVLPLGVYAHNLAIQIKHSWRKRQDGRFGQLICSANEPRKHRDDIVQFCPDGHEELLRTGMSQDSKKKAGRYTLKNRFRRQIRNLQNAELSPWQIQNGVCGDGLVNDRGEMCDPGSLGSYDPCCTRKCKLRPSAACSPAHHPCCTRDCQVAPSTYKCKLSTVDYKSCMVEETFCDGVNPTICSSVRNATDSPSTRTLANAADFSNCGHGRVCSTGKCMHYCTEVELDVPKYKEVVVCACGILAALQRVAKHKGPCNACCNESRISQTSCTATTEIQSDGVSCVFGTCLGMGCIRTDYRPDPAWDKPDYQALIYGKKNKREKEFDVTTLQVIFRWLYWILSSGTALAFIIIYVKSITSLSSQEGTERAKNEQSQNNTTAPKQENKTPVLIVH